MILRASTSPTAIEIARASFPPPSLLDMMADALRRREALSQQPPIGETIGLRAGDWFDATHLIEGCEVTPDGSRSIWRVTWGPA